MRTTTQTALAVAGLVLAANFNPALAQPQAPGGGVRTPTFSPYLNLANRGGIANPGITYLGIVRPQQQMAQQANQLQQQLTQTNQTLNGGTGMMNDNLFTGRGATFGYYSHYFYNSPTSGQGAGGGGFRSGGSALGGSTFGGGGAGALFRAGGAGSSVGQAPRAGGGAPRR